MTVIILVLCYVSAACFIQNMDILGNDLNDCDATTESALECQKKCKDTYFCRGFTWFSRNSELGSTYENKCCLKTDFTNLRARSGSISGSRFCGGKNIYVVMVVIEDVHYNHKE